MNIAPTHQVTNVPINDKIVTLMWVVPYPCPHCQKPFTEELACAVGPPYNCLLHAACLPFYEFPIEWPHTKTFHQYRRNSWTPKN